MEWNEPTACVQQALCRIQLVRLMLQLCNALICRSEGICHVFVDEHAAADVAVRVAGYGHDAAASAAAAVLMSIDCS
jgi:hypothetical protein